MFPLLPQDDAVIPGLAGSADIAGAGGAGTSEEYDTTTTGITWDSAPDTVNSDTTVKSHLYIEDNDNTEKIGTKAWTPGAVDFDVRAKMSIGGHEGGNASFGLYLLNSDNSKRVLIQFLHYAGGSSATEIRSYDYDGAFTLRNTTVWGANAAYFRIVRVGGTIEWYYSSDGLTWSRATTLTFTITVTKVGYRVISGASGIMKGTVDWLRTSV